ncbi:MAG: ribonuclease HII [Candidatus Aenigmatarchaeota archaeon]
MPKKVLGIDEAGRGPVIGPFVMCGFLLSEEKLPVLEKWGVKDSKKLSPRQRSFFYHKLKRLADDYAVVKLTAMDIDRLRNETNLNKIEIKHMQDIISTLKPDKVIIDAIEADTKKFRAAVLRGLSDELKVREKAGTFELVCENYADASHPIVGAASIIAKVIRDAEVRKLARRYGDFGSGYPSDPKTIAFLKDWLKKNKELPYFVRRSWVTARELAKAARAAHEQRKLKEFAEPKHW